MEELFYLAYVWNLVPTQTLNLADFFLLFQGKLTAAKLPAQFDSRKFITPSVQLCLQHVERDAKRRAVRLRQLILFDAGSVVMIVCGKRLRNGRVSVRPSVCPVYRQPVNSSDVQLVCRSKGAGGRYQPIAAVRARARTAASVNALIRGGSTQTCQITRREDYCNNRHSNRPTVCLLTIVWTNMHEYMHSTLDRHAEHRTSTVRAVSLRQNGTRGRCKPRCCRRTNAFSSSVSGE